jgi:hypothetical protein
MRLACLVALGLLAAGCAQPGVRSTGSPYAYGNNPREVLRYLQRGPDVRTTVIGNPTTEGDDVFAKAVTQAMNRRDWLPDVNFTTEPVSEASPGYRIVMVFGVERTLSSRELCAAQAGAYSARSGSGDLQSAFCWEWRPVSIARVQGAGLTASDDPGLELAVRAAMFRLFPLRLEREFDHRCFPRVIC